jgi:signal peptidase I
MRRMTPIGCALLFILLLITGCGNSRVTTITFQVTGSSMEPTLHASEKISVDTQAYASNPPARGDVILFHDPVDPKQELIKRVIGIPGDAVQTTPTQVFVNGKLSNESYISQPSNPNSESITVAPDQYFVMGDNRPVSEDSRSWGTVPKQEIIGKVILPSSLVFFPDM